MSTTDPIVQTLAAIEVRLVVVEKKVDLIHERLAEMDVREARQNGASMTSDRLRPTILALIVLIAGVAGGVVGHLTK